MTNEEVLEAMATVRETRDTAKQLSEAITAAEEAAGLPALRALKKLQEEKQTAAREQLNAWWNAFPEGQYPSKPKGLSFTPRDVTVIVDPSELPREAMKPDPKLVKPGMPGTFTCALFHATVKG